MRFETPLLEGRLIRRYKRFFADVELADGATVTAHCPNTGSLMGCLTPGSRVWLSRATNPARKLAFTWELVEVGPTRVGIHTGRSNALVREAIEGGAMPSLAGYSAIRREVPYGRHPSRIDLLLEGEQGRCYVEVKNVTAAVEQGMALFPDAVSERGTRHLREMIGMVEAGHRAVLVFCVQREDVDEVRPADAIDPQYGRALREALVQGVEVLAYRAVVNPEEVTLRDAVPVVCPSLV